MENCSTESAERSVPLWWRIGSAAGWIVAALSVFTFGLASVLPVYMDEITWTAILGRLNFDRGHSMSVTLSPTCMGTLTSVAPLVLRIPRWVDTWLYDGLSTPARLRAAGVAAVILWIFLAWRLAVPLVGRACRRTVLTTLLSWSTLGAMPFLLVLRRPEQALLIGTTALLLLGLRGQAVSQTLRRDALVAICLVAGSWYVMAEHPRGTFLLPLMCVCAWRCLAQRQFRIGAIAVLVSLGLLIARAWAPFIGCSDQRFAMETQLANFGAAHSVHRDMFYLHALASSLSRPHGWFLNEFTLKPEFTSQLIPAYVVPHAHLLLSMPTQILVTFALLAAVVFTGQAILRTIRGRIPPSQLLLLLAVWAAYLTNVFVRVVKADYEAAYMEPLIGLLAFASVWMSLRYGEHSDGRLVLRMEKGIRLFVTALTLLAIMSQVALLTYYLPQVRSHWFVVGQPDAQPLSVGIANDALVRSRVLAAARTCGIRAEDQLHHLVVDEVTYGPFHTSNEPVFVLYIDGENNARYRPDPTQLLESMSSSGMIVRCDHLPKAFAGSAKRGATEYCCLPSFVRTGGSAER